MLIHFRLHVYANKVPHPLCCAVEGTRGRGASHVCRGLVGSARDVVYLGAEEVVVGRYLLNGAQGRWCEQRHDVLHRFVSEVVLGPVAWCNVLECREAQLEHEVGGTHQAPHHTVNTNGHLGAHLRLAKTNGHAYIVALITVSYGQGTGYFVQ